MLGSSALGAVSIASTNMELLDPPIISVSTAIAANGVVDKNIYGLPISVSITLPPPNVLADAAISVPPFMVGVSLEAPVLTTGLYVLSPLSGEYNIAGQDVRLTWDHALITAAGDYNIVGKNARLYSSSFFYNDTEIIHVPAEPRYMKPSKVRIVPTKPRLRPR